MKFVELSKHLRELRSIRTGRLPSAAMRVMEVWEGAIECQQNGISEIIYSEASLPSPLLGFFARMRSSEQSGPGSDVAAIYVHKPHSKSLKRRLDPHWHEFVIIKELMHCWSPENTYVGSPGSAAELLSDLNTRSGPFTTNVAKSDYMAILAAAEVILPESQLRKTIAQGKEVAQIAVEHGLHPDVVAFICRHDILEGRRNGSL